MNNLNTYVENILFGLMLLLIINLITYFMKNNEKNEKKSGFERGTSSVVAMYLTRSAILTNCVSGLRTRYITHMEKLK